MKNKSKILIIVFIAILGLGFYLLKPNNTTEPTTENKKDVFLYSPIPTNEKIKAIKDALYYELGINVYDANTPDEADIIVHFGLDSAEFDLSNYDPILIDNDKLILVSSSDSTAMSNNILNLMKTINSPQDKSSKEKLLISEKTFNFLNANNAVSSEKEYIIGYDIETLTEKDPSLVGLIFSKELYPNTQLYKADVDFSNLEIDNNIGIYMFIDENHNLNTEILDLIEKVVSNVQ